MVVSLYLDTRATTGEAPVKASISNKTRKILIPIGIKILPSQWDAKSHIVKNHPKKKKSIRSSMARRATLNWNCCVWKG